MFTVTGPVQHGNKEARLLGVPTANVYTSRLVSELGVYAGFLHTTTETYKACIYIDTVPDQSSVKVEAHCIGFTDLDLYDKIVTIHATNFIRPKMTFGNLQECKQQIELDLEEIKKVLGI
jgi:riboflavin kinase/FMN adenylyltransferase